MSDHIIDNLNSDVALASALRNFLATPAIIDLVKAVVTEAVNAEIQRLRPVTLSHLTDLVEDIIPSNSNTAEENKFLSNLRVSISDMIEREVRDELQYYVHEDEFENKFNELVDIDSKITSAIENELPDQVSDQISEALRDLRIVRRD
jgi:hypothetical protein